MKNIFLIASVVKGMFALSVILFLCALVVVTVGWHALLFVLGFLAIPVVVILFLIER